MALPGQLMLGVVVVVKNHSLLGGLVMVPVTVLTGFYIAKRFSSIKQPEIFSGFVSKKKPLE